MTVEHYKEGAGGIRLIADDGGEVTLLHALHQAIGSESSELFFNVVDGETIEGILAIGDLTGI